MGGIAKTYEERMAGVEAELATIRAKLLAFSLSLRAPFWAIHDALKLCRLEAWVARRARRIWP